MILYYTISVTYSRLFDMLMVSLLYCTAFCWAEFVEWHAMQTGSAADWFYMDSPATWYCRKLRGGGYYFCSQSRTVSSLEPDATILPSGEKATLWAVPLPREPENSRRFDDKTSSPDLSESLPSAYFILLSTSSFCGRGGVLVRCRLGSQRGEAGFCRLAGWGNVLLSMPFSSLSIFELVGRRIKGCG